ncbi:MAG: DUF4258 domain-containing protein [Actinomycetota bacterium]|nr:DUF4258 domain-containing protein [Actinomycetota bacterium]MDA8279173.1 DUF4258 domain-containing protein [Actinomycetota bacterium]
MQRPKVVRFPVVLTYHVFEKLRSIDMTLAEFELLLGNGEVIEDSHRTDTQLEELVLISEWSRPLHLAVIVDKVKCEERIVTVYEPGSELWSPDYRTRRS